MKRAPIGWESDLLGSSGVQIITPIPTAITIRKLQLDIAFMAWQDLSLYPFGWLLSKLPGLLLKPITGGAIGWTEVLFTMYLDGAAPPNDFGKSILRDLSGSSQNLHGGGPATGNNLVNAILKGYVGRQNAVNKSIILDNLDVAVAAGTNLWMTAQQAGSGPLDFEVQGNLWYD